MYTIGLTGSIGAGKSTVARCLEDRGYPVLYADQLGHEAYLPNTTCFQKVLSAFGPEVVSEDGTVDRKKLGTIVFADHVKLQRLNEIVWPAIERLAKIRLRQLGQKSQDTIAFFEAAVLVEANWYTFVDEVWTILARTTHVINRVLVRDDSSKINLGERIAAQISTEERVRRSKVVIKNNGTIDDLYSFVDLELTNLQQRIKGDI